MKNQLGESRKFSDLENKQKLGLTDSSVLTKGKLSKEQIQRWVKLWTASFKDRYGNMTENEFSNWLER